MVQEEKLCLWLTKDVLLQRTPLKGVTVVTAKRRRAPATTSKATMVLPKRRKKTATIAEVVVLALAKAGATSSDEQEVTANADIATTKNAAFKEFLEDAQKLAAKTDISLQDAVKLLEEDWFQLAALALIALARQ
jgi:hypothetical protein